MSASDPDFERFLAEERAKMVQPASGPALPLPITAAEAWAINYHVEHAALDLAWRLLPPALDLPGAIAKRGAWVDHAEYLARYLRRRLGLHETPPLGSAAP